MTLAIETPRAAQAEGFRQNLPFWWIRAWLYRGWWHTKAYATIFGISVLGGLSLMVLYGHYWLNRKDISSLP